jgi:hypothetical protein
MSYSLPKLSKPAYGNTSALLRFLILATISAAAVASRLFAVIRHESIIHELCVRLRGVGLPEIELTTISPLAALQRPLVQLVRLRSEPGSARATRPRAGPALASPLVRCLELSRAQPYLPLQPREQSPRQRGLLCACSQRLVVATAGGQKLTAVHIPQSASSQPPAPLGCLCRPLLQEFWNWFDPTAWYPLGRVVGGTVYPGLMATAGVIWNALRLVNLEVDIRNVCVMMAPAFSGLTAWSTYLCVLIILKKNIGIVQLSPGRLTPPLSRHADSRTSSSPRASTRPVCWPLPSSVLRLVRSKAYALGGLDAAC